MVQRGSSNFPRQARDTYITPREPVVSLILSGPTFGKRICDPCCGNGALLKALEELGYDVFGSDLEPFGPYPKQDFIASDPWASQYDIITNPPYGPQGMLARMFIERALECTQPWQGKVAMLLPMDYDSGSTRRHVFGDHPAFVCKVVLCYRIKWFGDQGGEQNFAWYVWDWKNESYPRIIYAYRSKL